MIVYHRFHMSKIIGNSLMQTWTDECEKWLKENVSNGSLRELNASQFPQTSTSAKNLVELTMDYQAAHQNGLEDHYDIDLHSVYISGFRHVVDDKWSYWRIVPDITHDEHVYFIFNIQDDLLAMQFKLANL
jgi:hypothetical protein